MKTSVTSSFYRYSNFKNLLNRYLAIILFVISVVGNIVWGQVTLPHYDAINYTVGQGLQSQSGWTSLNSGDDLLISAGNLSYNSMPVSTGNKVTFDGAGIDAAKLFTQQTSGTVYYSFLMDVTSLGSLNATGSYFTGITEGASTNFGGTVWLRSDGVGYDVGINPRTTAANTVWTSGTTMINGTHLIVVSYQILSGTANDVVKLWVDPVFEGSEPVATLNASNTGTDLANLNRILVRQDAATTTPFIQMDELRVGTGWHQVVPYYTTAADGDWHTGSTWVGGNVPSSGAVVVIAHNVTLAAPLTNTGIVTVNTGASLAVGATYTNNGTTTINGTFQINQSGYTAGNNFVYGAGGTLIFNQPSGVFWVYNAFQFWPVSNGPTNVTVQGAGIRMEDAYRTVSGTFQTSSLVELGEKLTMNGVCRLNAGGYFVGSPTYSSSSTLAYSTGGTYGRGAEWSAVGEGTIGITPGYPNHVSVGSSTTLNLPNGSNDARACAGNLFIDNGSSLYADYGGGSVALTVGGDFIMAGNLSLGSNAGGDLTVKGNWTKTGGTFNPNDRAVFFTGTGEQTITGATTFDYMIVDKSTNYIVLDNDITINKTLTLTNGLINTGTNKVMITSTGSISRTNGWVYGNLQKYIPGGNITKLFEVGGLAPGSYNPAEFFINNVSTPGNLTVNVFQVDHPDIAASALTLDKTLNRYWQVTNDGIVFNKYDFKLYFNDPPISGEVDPGVDVYNFYCGKFSSGSWTYPEMWVNAINYTGMSNETAFCDFQLAERCFAPSGLTYNDPMSGPNPAVYCQGTTISPNYPGVSGTLPFTYAIVPALPSGLNFDTNNGAITGTPSVASPATDYTVTVTNDCGSDIEVVNITVLALQTWYQDSDGDTYGNSAVSQSACTQPVGYVADNTDCNDADNTIWQSATLYIDADNDNYDAGQQVICYGNTIPTGYKTTTLGTDCNDSNAAINPGAAEVCDGVDNDCDGLTDSADPGLTGKVTNSNNGKSFCTIQEAIDDALTFNGHIISISAGTFIERVTVSKQLTLQGAGENLTILNGAGLSGNGSGILINNGITNVTISDLTVKNYAGNAPNSFAGIYAVGGNDNLTVQNCTLKDNVGGCGFYANGPVTNVILDNLDVSGHTNTFGAARGIVIWNGLKSNITVTDCDVYNNNCCGIELQDGTATGVTMTDNNVHDNGDNGFGLTGMQGPGENLIENNILTNNGRFGIEIKNPDGSGLDSGPGSIVVENNTVTRTDPIGGEVRDIVGIAAFRRGVLAGNVDIPTGVVIQNNTVSGYIQPSTSDGFGIVAEGINHSVLNNNVSGCDVGIQRQAGHLPYPGDGDQGNLSDTYFGRGNSPYTCGITISGNTLSNTVDTRDVGTVNGVNIVKNNNTNEQFCTIQQAIDDAQTLNTHLISVPAGTYQENIVVSKSLTIAGPNADIDPTSGLPRANAEAIIIPASNDPANGRVIDITADNVVINGFTVDGDNTSIGGGVAHNGADINAQFGIGSGTWATGSGGKNGMQIKYNIVKNCNDGGIYGNGGGTPAEGGLFSYNFIDNSPWWGIVMESNCYTGISHNKITNVSRGIQFDNYWVANSTGNTLIENNDITYSKRGILQNLFYGSASLFEINSNTLTASATPEAANVGLLYWSVASGITATATNNTINANEHGARIWNCQGNVSINGGTINGGQIGVYASTTDAYGDGTNQGSSINGVALAGSSAGGDVGIKAYSHLSGLASSLLVSNNCSVSGYDEGILAEGADATISVTNNISTITGNLIGIHVKDGADLISCTNNTITNNTQAGILIESTAGTIGAIESNTISGNGYAYDAVHGRGLQNDLAIAVDASPDYWGDATGPYNNNKNLCGQGNAVIGNVTFSPWWTTPTGVEDSDSPPDITTCPPSYALNGCNTGAITGLVYSETAVEVTQAQFNSEGGVATDDCGITYYGYQDVSSGTCPVIVTRTWTVKDGAGNTTTCVQTITINHQTAPAEFGGPVSTSGGTVECISSVSAPTVLPLVKDMCGTTLSPSSPSIGGTYSGANCEGTRTYSYTYTDCANLTYTWVYTYTIDDTQIPLVTSTTYGGNPGENPDIDDYSCGSVYNFNTGPNSCFATKTITRPVWSDNCGGTVLRGQTTNNGVVLSVSPGTPGFVTGNFPAGATVITFTGTDCAGNVGTCQLTIVVNDNIVPTLIGCPEDPVVNADQGLCSAVVSLVSPVASDNCGISSITHSASGATTFSGTGFLGSHTFNGGINGGVTNVTYTVSDGTNTASCNFTVTVADNQQPAVTCAGPVNVNADFGVCTYAGSQLSAPPATDNCSVVSVLPSPASLVLGLNTVTWTATDIGGNTKTCTQSVTVIDDELPEITCKSDQVRNTNTACTYTANGTEFDPENKSDNCGITSQAYKLGAGAPVIATTLNGVVFPLGETQVTWIIGDASGNTATCSFKVTVNDAELPVITCPADLDIDATGCNATVVSLGTPVTDDNCGVQSVVNDHPSDQYPVGTTTVTWTVTDINGNSNTCEQLVIVSSTSGALYVNDNSTTGDTYTTAVGDDITGNGTSCAPFATLTKAISEAATGNTIYVDAGIYAENVIVNRSVSILGPNATIDPCNDSRVAEAIIVPGTDDVVYGEIFHVAASDVSVKGFTIDGDNPAFAANGFGFGGADMHAAEGVTVYETGINNLTVSNNIIKNLSYFGVTLYDYIAGVPSSGHIISNNKITDLGTYAPASGIDYWGGGVLLYNNQYTKLENNCMTNVRLGLQTGNYYQANPGDSQYQEISNNTIQSRRTGVFHNLHYSAASPMTFSGNTITALADINETKWDGIALSSLSVPSYSTGNIINGNGIVRTNKTKGYELWNVKNTYPAEISGGSVTGVDYGVFANNYEGYSSDAGDGAHGTVNGVTITPNAGGIGVRILDSPSGTTHAPVIMTLSGNNITGALEGIKFERTSTGIVGGTITGNTISASSVGINIPSYSTSVSNGLTIQNNNITLTGQIAGTTPTTGIILANISGAQAATVSGNNITGPFYGYLVYNLNTTPVTSINGGSITGIMQGLAAINVDPVTGTSFAPSTFNADGITMSGFTGDYSGLPGDPLDAYDFHAGVYVFTAGSALNKITSVLSNLNISGTGKHSQASAGMSFSDFSTAVETMQSITVNGCNISNNLNRGINARGSHNFINVNTSTLLNNGGDPYGSGGNDGFGIISRLGSTVNVKNCFISNPASVTAPYNVTALFNDQGNMVATDNNLNQNGNLASWLAYNNTGTLDATCNWWGTADPAGVLAKINPSSVPAVTYITYYTDGTDQGGNPADGFQPDLTKCYGSPISLICVPDQTETACQTQASINGKFAIWLASTTYSGCNGILTTVPVSPAAPSACGGSTTVTWTYTSDCGVLTCTATFSVTPDITAPLLTGTAYTDATVYNSCKAGALAAVPAWSEANAITGYTDNCGAVSAILTNTEVSGTDCDWTVTYTYTVSDACLNPLTDQTYTHSGNDQTIPVITINGNTNEYICQGLTYTDAGASAIDNCSGNITADILTNNTVNTSVPGTYFVYYNVKDACDNPAVQQIRQVIVNAVPVVSAVTLQTSTTGVSPWTAVSGDLLTGYEMCIDPLIPFHYLDIDALTANVALKQNTLNGFSLDQTSLPANWLAYWSAKGVVNGAGGWQGVMWNIINGTAPIFYINYTGTDYQLIDGLTYQIGGGLTPLRITGDYPEWNYKYSGTVESAEGCISSFFDVFMELNSAPVVSAVTLQTNTTGVSPWTAVSGDLATGYEMCIDPLIPFHYLDIDALTANVALKQNTLNGFKLDQTSLPANWLAYWSAKGVVNGAGGWQGVMWNIINGTAPIFYINYTGTDYQLIDGLTYQIGGGLTPLRITGDYPEWNYKYSGTVESAEGCISSFFDVFMELNSAPVVSAVTLQTNTTGVSPWTAVSGDLSTGYEMCIDPLIPFHYLDIDALTANVALKQNALNGFRLDQTSLPANWLAYWSAKGVVNGAGGWQGVMWNIINGTAPILYINYTGTDYQLIDGLTYQIGGGLIPLRITGDYPEWNYKYTGNVESAEGCISSFFDVFMELNSAPVVSAVTLQTNTTGVSPWTAVSGDLATGYEMCIDPLIPFHYLDINALTANVALKQNVLNGFSLDQTSLPANWLAYWSAKGVVNGAGGWQGVMWNIINGTNPIFYINYTGTDYQLIDGLTYQTGGGLTPLRITGDYPEWNYKYTGTVESSEGCISSFFDVFMELNSVPVVTCPANIVVNNDPGSCGALVAFAATSTGIPTPTIIYKIGATTITSPYNFPRGTTNVDVTATNACGSSICSFTVTVNDNTVPQISCPANVTVNQHDEKDPFATGYATATDNCSGTIAITYTDNRSGLYLCNATGVISRTWKAADVSNNSITCVQEITVQDIDNPVAVCPGNITVPNDPGICGATVNFASDASDFGHFQGFENPQWVSGRYTDQPSVDWNEYSSQIVRAASGTDGIVSRSGSAHGVVNSTVLPSSPYDYSGIFSRLGGYNAIAGSFGNGFTSSVDVYFDIDDPKVSNSTYGWDVSTAVNDQAGGHRRDFIFHAAGEPGKIVIAADNGTSFARRNDLSSLPNHYDVITTGWYKLEWKFRNNGGVLAVDCNLYNDAGTLLFTETRSDPGDLIASEIGGNRYMWFTFVEADKLAIDNTSLTRKPLFTVSQASGTVFSKGTTAVTITATDACGRVGTCGFNITVNDTELPVITCQNDQTRQANTTGCVYTVIGDEFNPVSYNDNCAGSTIINSYNNTNTLAGAVFSTGTTAVTWTVTDASGNTKTCSFNVIIAESQLQIFEVTGGGTACANEPGVLVGLSDSETGVNYRLYLNGIATGSEVAGTGDPISFGYQTIAGTYNVKAVHAITGCPEVPMNSGVIVIINPVPDAIISGTATVVQNAATTATITFTGSNGTAPYTFTYRVNNGPYQTVTTITGNTTTVAQSNAVVGVFVYELISVSDANGCVKTFTPPYPNAIITVIPASSTTDIRVRWQVPFNGTFTPGQTKDAVIRLNEVGGIATNGIIQVFIPRISGYTLSFDPSQTNATNPNVPVGNSTDGWSVFTYPNGALLLSTSNSLPASSEFKVAIKLTATSSMNSSILKAVLLPGSGGDTNAGNNTSNINITTL